MTNIKPTVLARRDFLRGAVCLAGAAALGLKTGPAAHGMAALMGSQAAPISSLAYCSGERLISAEHLSSGDASLCSSGVGIEIHNHVLPCASHSPALRSVKAHFPIQNGADVEHVPFHAWAASKYSDGSSKFTMPVDANHGLRLSIKHKPLEDHDAVLNLAVDASANMPKLKAGTYVLAAGGPNFLGCRVVERNGKMAVEQRTPHGFAPANFEYVLITVSRTS